ncbi:hypothetical protein BGZ83_005231 [Gryganskiella cystojenkinii]|nr:hypothetical protein BGZ83_005231 [Gryganskiella cystojenkinii]
MKSPTVPTLLSAFVLALTALSFSGCNGQGNLQDQANVNIAISHNSDNNNIKSKVDALSAREDNENEIYILRSYLRPIPPSRRRHLFENKDLHRRGLLGDLLPPLVAPTELTTTEATAHSPSPHSPTPSPSPHTPSTGPTTTRVEPTSGHTPSASSPPSHSPDPPVTSDPPTPPPTTTDVIPPPVTTASTTTVAPVTPTTATTTEAPTTLPPTVPPTTSTTTAPPVKPTTNPPVIIPTTKTRGPGPVTTNGGGHVPSGSGNGDPSSTSSTGATLPSEAASTSQGSSSNKTAITIGVVIGAIVVAGGIGVWVFRKWKLSPSRQFKSKIRNSSNTGAGGFGSGRSLEDDDIEYAQYTDIFRPQAHDSSLPITASSMKAAAAVGGAAVVRGGSRSGPSSNASSNSPPLQYLQEHVHDGSQFYSTGQPQLQYPSPPQGHQHVNSLSSDGTVPDYNSYRYPVTVGQYHQQMSGGHGYDVGIAGAYMTGNPQGYAPTGAEGASTAHTSYTSSGYPATDHFLRELRE